MLCDAAPLSGRRGIYEGKLNWWWEQRVAAICHVEPARRGLELTALGDICKLGWEGADRHWCGDEVHIELDILRSIRRRNCSVRRQAARAAAKAAQ